MSSQVDITEAVSAIKKDGFFCFPDIAISNRIAELRDESVQFDSTDSQGLEFYRDYVLRDVRIQSILASFFDWCALGDYRSLKADPQHIFQFRRGGSRANVIIVSLWSGNTNLSYYACSHLIPYDVLQSPRASNRLFEPAKARLARHGSEHRVIPFLDGGIVIMDARTALELTGSMITCSFTDAEELTRWKPLSRPNSSDSDELIASLSTERIGAHFDTQKEQAE